VEVLRHPRERLLDEAVDQRRSARCSSIHS
jgi:hypothetical protein